MNTYSTHPPPDPGTFFHLFDYYRCCFLLSLTLPVFLILIIFYPLLDDYIFELVIRFSVNKKSVKISRKSTKMEGKLFLSIAVMLCFCLGSFADSNTVPASPVQSQSQLCKLDLSEELFSGVKAACREDLDRRRCCPVLSAWFYAAYAHSALRVIPAPAPSAISSIQPSEPLDNQKCADSLQDSLQRRSVYVGRINETCDTVLCFCGIRLHQISSLECPAAFNISAAGEVKPTAAVRDLEHKCRASSYSGCTQCLGALQKLKGGGKNGTQKARNGENGRLSKMLNQDCQLMGLTWLLARNKTAYIPTVSAVLRALMYSGQPLTESKCSPDQENMPLAVDSLQFQNGSPTASSLSIYFSQILSIIIICMINITTFRINY
ncbi:unnamed protein product [Cuscuta epithymum]|uniref:SPARK domain-containing protein n=1 Tax=Cuscuta epithymum TaxID=186058 RepID=A0AAV0CCC6_9ASTE|nr:unnamed protein product [Cuscuta epithymum]